MDARMNVSAVVTWDRLSARQLAARCGAARLELFDETNSTLDVAHTLAEQGAEAGTVIVADSQRAGRGRQGRAWSSPPGRGVWCAIIERPIDASALDVLSLRVGLGIAEGLDAYAGARVGLKWPNDLVLEAGKLGGILVEARWSGTTLGWVAIGVGVNVLTPMDVAFGAGLRTGTARVDVLTAVVHAVRAAAARTGVLTADEVSRYQLRDALRGRRITEPLDGVVVSVAPNGELLVKTARGAERVRAGSIRLLEDT
jgi:BirA family biotin operon repressor/biotin-[acetyl-CoA-carboxylase] ligase